MAPPRLKSAWVCRSDAVRRVRSASITRTGSVIRGKMRAMATHAICCHMRLAMALPLIRSARFGNCAVEVPFADCDSFSCNMVLSVPCLGGNEGRRSPTFRVPCPTAEAQVDRRDQEKPRRPSTLPRSCLSRMKHHALFLSLLQPTAPRPAAPVPLVARPRTLCRS